MKEKEARKEPATGRNPAGSRRPAAEGCTRARRRAAALSLSLALAFAGCPCGMGAARASGTGMTVTMDMEIPLAYDQEKQAFTGTGTLWESCGNGHAHRMVRVSLPERFRIMTPAGEKDAPEGTAVSYTGCMTARRGFHNLHSSTHLGSEFSVSVPLTGELLGCGAGDYSLAVPFTLSEEEAYGSYGEGFAFTRWEDMAASGLVELKEPSTLSRVRMSGDALEIPPSVTCLGSSILAGHAYREVDVPGTVTEGGWAFDSGSVEKVYFEGSIRTVPDNICRNAAELKEAVLPEGVEGFGAYAFSGCASLQGFSFPSTMKTLEKGSFEGCGSLRELTVRSDLATDALTSAASPLRGTGIERITVEEGVTAIPSYLYTEASALKELSLPASLQSIGSYSFSGCTSLEKLEIRSDVTVNATRPPFWGGGLREITFGEGVTAVPARMFDGSCASLTDVFLPASLQRIGASAFRGSGAATVHFAGTPEQWQAVAKNGWEPAEVIYGNGAKAGALLAASFLAGEAGQLCAEAPAVPSEDMENPEADTGMQGAGSGMPETDRGMQEAGPELGEAVALLVDGHVPDAQTEEEEPAEETALPPDGDGTAEEAEEGKPEKETFLPPDGCEPDAKAEEGKPEGETVQLSDGCEPGAEAEEGEQETENVLPPDGSEADADSGEGEQAAEDAQPPDGYEPDAEADEVEPAEEAIQTQDACEPGAETAEGEQAAENAQPPEGAEGTVQPPAVTPVSCNAAEPEAPAPEEDAPLPGMADAGLPLKDPEEEADTAGDGTL